MDVYFIYLRNHNEKPKFNSCEKSRQVFIIYMFCSFCNCCYLSSSIYRFEGNLILASSVISSRSLHFTISNSCTPPRIEICRLILSLSLSFIYIALSISLWNNWDSVNTQWRFGNLVTYNLRYLSLNNIAECATNRKLYLHMVPEYF